ncbi:MAG: tetrahydrofolate dehydrogenase/cyclohydrolase catalytic domain-containing protein, partial [Myxococcota bacterium]
MTKHLDPNVFAQSFRAEVKQQIELLDRPLTLQGFLCEGDKPSRVYASYTEKGCAAASIRFALKSVTQASVEAAILEANADPNIDGILVYYPIFRDERDIVLRNLVSAAKDVEGLHAFWVDRLYRDIRHVDAHKMQKSIVPCTPLAIVKLLEASGCYEGGASKPLAGKSAVIFNRSEVVGRPLASMLAHDGAEVISFDEHGPMQVGEAGQLHST